MRARQVLPAVAIALFAGGAQAAENDCSGGLVYDDSQFTNGYRLNSLFGSVFVMKVDPPAGVNVLKKVCVCWLRDSRDANLEFGLQVFDSNGPDGAPGTLLGELTGQTAAGIGTTSTWFSYDFSSVEVPFNRSVYIGPSWQAYGKPIYLCTDTSPSTPRQRGFYGDFLDDAPDSEAGVAAIPDYRAFGIRATAQHICGDANSLCLGDGRFTAEVDWRNQYSGATGRGIAIPRTSAAGFFAFDNAQNVELVLKILDFGGTVKVFYSQLTDLEFTLKITDNATGAVETYGPTPGNCGDIDQDAFKRAGDRGRLNKRIARNKFQAGFCSADRFTACLLNNRFQVRVRWSNQYNNTSGDAPAVPLSNLSGLFNYGDPNNVELLVKTLDFGDRILFLYGALSDLGYTITLTDTLTNAVKTYNNAPGHYCGGIDNDAF